jgi:2-polyprenyl-6-methoxyphenol hydroxylase-like FAD-dependent oxidoreductase
VTAHRIVPGKDDGPVTVHGNDGSTGVYDLVVGADGVFSSVRRMLWPEAPEPWFTGQACWRLVAPRPTGFERSHFYMGGDLKLGFNPVSTTHMYMFLLQHAPGDPWVPLEEQAERLEALMAGFGGIVPEVRAGVRDNPTINYRPLKIFFLERPWRKGRVILLGDAVHATTPHLASGAGMAVEDAVVLAEEIRVGDVPAALDRFTDRRFTRCRDVIRNSVRLGELEMTHGSPQEHRDLMAASIAALRQPI